MNTNCGFIIYTQVRMTKLLVMLSDEYTYKLRLHYVYTSQDTPTGIEDLDPDSSDSSDSD